MKIKKQIAEDRRRIKVRVLVDSELLREVDRFVGARPELDRGRVFDEALHLWFARHQEQAMIEQFTPAKESVEQVEREAWRKIHAAAAERIFRRP